MSEPENFTFRLEEVPDGHSAPSVWPLMSGEMQKDDMIRFIQGKCQDCSLVLNDPDQLKSYFFWMIMELFCKKNGRVMMAEIAVVLFRGYGFVRRKVGCVRNQEDWCLPLAKLLCAALPADQHRKAIIEMGDDFGFRGWLYAAHICYVVAQLALGGRKQFQLIGFEWFLNYQSVSKEVMERTETYEYVLSLSSGLGQPHFQEFKYYYAWDLVNAGACDLALRYCENIARNIFTFPRLISSFFMERVIMLCSRLLEGKRKDEVTWMLKLCRLHKAFSISNPGFSADLVGSSSPSHEVQEFEEELDSRYTVGELLGKGFFGAVYAGVRKADGEQVAVKYVAKRNKDFSLGEKPMEVLLMEIVSKPPRCENVLELLEWFDMPTTFILVLERPIPCMDLRKFCDSHTNGHLPEYKAREVIRQMIQAIRHCIERRVLHEDIRSSNILVNTDTLEVKLIDFGCGKLLQDICPSSSVLSSYVCSLGVLLVEMISGDPAFHRVDFIIEQSSEVISRECRELLFWWLKNPRGLPTFDEILSHNWFKLELQDMSQGSGLDEE